MKYKRLGNCCLATEDGKYTIRKYFVTDTYLIYENGKQLYDDDLIPVGFGYLKYAKAYIENLYKERR